MAAGICRVADPDGKDLIWILEAPTPGADDLASDPLGVPFNSGQFTAEEEEYAELRLNIEEVIDRGVFSRKDGLNRPGFTGGQNSRRIAHYGTDIKEENLEAIFT